MGPELLTPMHLIFLAILGLLLFGPKRLPEIGRSLGTGLREFRSSMNGTFGAENAHEYPAAPATPPTAPGVTATPSPGNAGEEPPPAGHQPLG
jgi:sec-independent protein translocase protein TatA